uniref:C-type lectin domain-containing protein n=1 Tax=Anopheles farauti TaxID=69004 RepID=A0A182QM41_9DIPT
MGPTQQHGKCADKIRFEGPKYDIGKLLPPGKSLRYGRPRKCGDYRKEVYLQPAKIEEVQGVALSGPAVNISNTWTLPQEGFSVFYRYFRDKISWFEADAVCQFHHANLVTVDNGVQFDATRAFLKELDVTSAVWIGLMRPENSARFTWTSSKALDPASGYWAEAIPAMEQPLCAVVDPVRDFRWHALRCGGPETAAFLCELPVPSWAVDCTITSIPSLTVQYMSDSGTVQLSRDCGESGTKHISCQGKQDRDSIIEQLQCSEEEDLASVLATENNNLLQLGPGAEGVGTASSTRRPQPPQILEHDILTVVSANDDDSNNKIEVNPNQIEDTVKNVINKFNLQDLMRSEQAALHSEEVDGVSQGAGSLRKAAYGKKYSPLYEKKNRYAKKLPERNESGADEEDEEDEPMMGDQPMQDETETQPIDIIQQAVKPTADGDYADSTIVAGGVKNQPHGEGAGEPDVVTTPDSRLRRGTDADGEALGAAGTTEMSAAISTSADLTDTTTPTATTSATTTVMTTTTGLPPTLLTTRTTVASHILPTTPKKEVITGDHFIPPMLLVKARFISARPHTETPPTTMFASTASSTTTTKVESAVTEPLPTVFSTQDASAGSDPLRVASSTEQTAASSEANVLATGTSTDAHQVVDVVFDQTQPSHSPDQVGASLTITTRPFTVPESDAAQKKKEEVDIPHTAALVSTIQLTQYSDFNTTTAAPVSVSTAQPTEASNEPDVSVDTHTTESDGAAITSTLPASGEQQQSTVSPWSQASVGSTEVPERLLSTVGSSEPAPKATNHAVIHTQLEDELFAATLTSTTTTTVTITTSATPTGVASTIPTNAHDEAQQQSAEEHADGDETENSELHNSFSNVENYQPYKPNRHRTLTKPEVHNNHGAYIKKILG